MKKNMNKLDEKLRIFGRTISSWWSALNGAEKFAFCWLALIALAIVALSVAFWNPVGMIALAAVILVVFLGLTLFAAVVVIEHLDN